MNSIRALVGMLLLWSSTAWGATLTWQPNHDPDLAGYRVYQCSQLPCTHSSGHVSLLATLGKTTSFNIGTPAVLHHYFVTAYDFANKESGHSNLVTFPPPLHMAPVTLTVVGHPGVGGPWGVKATTTDHRDLMAKVYLDGAVHHVEHRAPYSFPGDNGTTTTTERFGLGSHTVEFEFYVEGSTTVSGRACMTVHEGNPFVGAVTLTVVGHPASGPWGVKATTTDHRDLMATVHLDGAVHHVEHTAPYSFPGDNGTTTTTELFGHGWHTVEFEFYLEGTTTKIGRGCVTVQETAS